MKKTLVLGASPNPARMSNMVTKKLISEGHEVIPFGSRKGEIEGLEIETEQPDLKDLDTITLYLNPARQKEYYDYILGLRPKRLIFNPGTGNFELFKLAKDADIEPIMACTKVMLSIGNY